MENRFFFKRSNLSIQAFLVPKDATKALENARWRRIVIERLHRHQERWRSAQGNNDTPSTFMHSKLSKSQNCHTQLKTPHVVDINSRKKAGHRKPSLETNSYMIKSNSCRDRRSDLHRNPFRYCLLSATRKLLTQCKHHREFQALFSTSALSHLSRELHHNLYVSGGSFRQWLHHILQCTTIDGSYEAWGFKYWSEHPKQMPKPVLSSSSETLPHNNQDKNVWIVLP